MCILNEDFVKINRIIQIFFAFLNFILEIKKSNIIHIYMIKFLFGN